MQLGSAHKAHSGRVWEVTGTGREKSGMGGYLIVVMLTNKCYKRILCCRMFMHTSIFLPSTTVPWSLSRAWSASALFANVTKPNPCMQDRQNMQCKNCNGQIFKYCFILGVGHGPATCNKISVYFLHEDYTVNCTQNLQEFSKM